MSDRLVEFFNGDVSYADLVAGKALLTNAAGESAVVRDVLIAADNLIPLRLKAGPAIIARASGGSALSGSEIVGAGSSLVIDTPLRPLINRLGFCPVSGTTAMTLRMPTRWSGGVVFGGAAALTSMTIESPAVPAGFAAIGADGALYYAQGAVSSGIRSLYKRAGGPSGAQSVVDASFGDCACYDGARWIYGLTDSSMTLKRLDTTTGAVTSVTITGLSGNIAGTVVVAACDGWLLLRPSYNTTICVVNATTGVAVNLGVGGTASAVRYFGGLYKTSAGDYVGLIITSSSTIDIYRFGASLAAPAPQVTTLTISLSKYSGSTNLLLPLPTGSDTAVLLGSSATNAEILLIDLRAAQMISRAQETTVSNTGLTPYLLPSDAAVAAADFGTVSVRVTGIKSTG